MFDFNPDEIEDAPSQEEIDAFWNDCPTYLFPSPEELAPLVLDEELTEVVRRLDTPF